MDPKQNEIHVNVCDTLQLLAVFLQCNGGKLEEAEDFKCVFVIYCLLEWKYIGSREITQCLSVSCTKINHSRCMLVI